VTPNAASKIYGDADPTLTGTLTGFLGGDGITATYSRTAGETVGTYTISATLSPAGVLGNYAITYSTATFTIGKAALIVTTDNKSKTYSSPNPLLTGSIIGIKFSDTITASWSTTATLTSGVGTYPITATLSDNGSGKLANYTVTNPGGTLTVLAANGTVTYTGLQDYTTASSSSSTAAVSSSAYVSVSAGDITTAKVVFTATPISGGAPQTCTASAGAISATTGSASCTWTGSVGAAGGQSYTVTAALAGNYTGPSDQATVNVHLPNQTNFITGGGQLVLTSNQVGKFAGDVGSKANLGLNVKYNKAGTNLQGNANIIVRRGTTIFHFKSNVLLQLNVDATKGAATFTSKATAETWDAATPTIITSLGGNFTIQVQMHDVPNSGPAKDTLGITIWDGSGALVFSSYWDAITKTTKEQAIGGGNLQVH